MSNSASEQSTTEQSIIKDLSNLQKIAAFCADNIGVAPPKEAIKIPAAFKGNISALPTKVGETTKGKATKEYGGFEFELDEVNGSVTKTGTYFFKGVSSTSDGVKAALLPMVVKGQYEALQCPYLKFKGLDGVEGITLLLPQQWYGNCEIAVGEIIEASVSSITSEGDVLVNNQRSSILRVLYPSGTEVKGSVIHDPTSSSLLLSAGNDRVQLVLSPEAIPSALHPFGEVIAAELSGKEIVAKISGYSDAGVTVSTDAIRELLRERNRAQGCAQNQIVQAKVLAQSGQSSLLKCTNGALGVVPTAEETEGEYVVTDRSAGSEFLNLGSRNLKAVKRSRAFTEWQNRGEVFVVISSVELKSKNQAPGKFKADIVDLKTAETGVGTEQTKAIKGVYVSSPEGALSAGQHVLLSQVTLTDNGEVQVNARKRPAKPVQAQAPAQAKPAAPAQAQAPATAPAATQKPTSGNGNNKGGRNFGPNKTRSYGNR